MSAETMTWLNNNTLVGFTEKRGNAWHYKASKQGAEPNHYTGPVPVADVKRRLFHWHAVEGTLETTVTTLSEDGVTTRHITDDTRKTIVRPDTGLVLNTTKLGFQIHQYDEWLLGELSTLLGDTLFVGSAGLLRGGAVAWVSVETPETVTTPEGVAFRPHFLAATSLDGSLATTYKPVVTNVVCDNTMSAALAEASAQVKVRHSRYSALRLPEARKALGIIDGLADAFAAEVAELCQTTVTDRELNRFLELAIPVSEKPGSSRTQALRKHDEVKSLWRTDLRVEPWKNTAWGVVQAMNTHAHWYARGSSARAERNTNRALGSDLEKLDLGTLATLRKAQALV